MWGKPAHALLAASAWGTQEWQVVNQDCVSGSHLHDRGVWVAGTTTSYAACQALCAANATCNACDWAGDTDLGGEKCFPKGRCYFRADAVWLPHKNGKCNHTAGRPLPAGSCPKVDCHSDVDCAAGPANCSWCRSPTPGAGNVQLCGGPPAPNDCAGLPAPPKNASAVQYQSMGDSVSKGIFGPLQALAQAAPFGWEAFHPSSDMGGGCGNSVRGKDCTPFWLEGANRSLDRQWDVITFNYGLHDLANDSERVPLAQYQANLRNVSRALLAAPGKPRLFWLSSTPVPDIPLKPPRAQDDVPLFNDAAASVMAEFPSITTIDVYTFILGLCGGDPHYLACPEYQTAGVHFKQEGYQAMASFIFDAINVAPPPPPTRRNGSKV